MKSIEISIIKNKVMELIAEASFNLPPDIRKALEKSREFETSQRARDVLDLILKNADIAAREKLPLCQDCGRVYIGIGIGPCICIPDPEKLNAQLDLAVAAAYNNNYLRKSVVNDPLFERANTGDNTPAIITTFFSSGPGLSIDVVLKGGGSENCSYLYMQNPSMSQEELIGIVLKTVRENVTKCCPPVIIGVGVGGTASEVPKLAWKASLRKLGCPSGDQRYRELENMILEAVNSTGIGPQGLGGKTTALGCNIEYAPCHIATMPVAVFMSCHSTRRASAKLLPGYDCKEL
ncbi:MAG: fumarate hydratase [Actinobacteria bacterium]|nr:fumarate hydratase [Actinomycetota bacterium]